MRGGSSTESSSTPAASRGGAGEGGFVLVSVLWLLALLGAVAATFVTVTRLHVQAGANATRNAGAELAADGAARLIAFRLATAPGEPSEADLLPVDGAPFRCLLPGGRIALVAVQDQEGLADLNAAPPALIAWALENAGVPAGLAEQMAAAVVDFRDADDDVTNGGAESAAYREAERPLGPKNAPFQAVAELDQVLGFDAAAQIAVRTAFTVHSRTDGVDPRVVPRSSPPSALPLASQAYAAGDGRAAAAVPDAFVRPSRHRHFAILAAGETEDGGRFLRRAVIEVLRQPEQPFRVLEWGQVVQAEEWPIAAVEETDAARPCAG